MIFSIFNGFPFHYETFGVFIYMIIHTYTDPEIRIYTNQSNTLQWLEFYKARFSLANVSIFTHDDFKEAQFIESSCVILTTDDDATFPIEFLKLSNTTTVLCYDHNIALRQPHIAKHITTRPYFTIERRDTPYIYPVYPIISREEKRDALLKETTINIAVVGGTWNTNNYWKYLFPNNNMNKIKIFFIHRHNPCIWARMDKYVKSICPNTEIHTDCNTFELMNLLKRSHYIAFLTDIDQFVYHSCSGSIGLALSTGCTMLMTRKYNSEYKFKNPVYFDDYPTLTNEFNPIVYEEQTRIIEHNLKVFTACLE